MPITRARKKRLIAQAAALARKAAAADYSYSKARATAVAQGLPFIRKTEYLALRRGETGKPKVLRAPSPAQRIVRARRGEAPLYGRVKDAGRTLSDAPQFKKGIIGVSRLRSTRFRRYYYVDVRFRQPVFTKKGGTQTRYTTIYLGTFTPFEFRQALNQGGVKRRIDSALKDLVGEVPPYVADEFWVSRGGKERL